jgi:hypothetical protein
MTRDTDSTLVSKIFSETSSSTNTSSFNEDRLNEKLDNTVNNSAEYSVDTISGSSTPSSNSAIIQQYLEFDDKRSNLDNDFVEKCNKFDEKLKEIKLQRYTEKLNEEKGVKNLILETTKANYFKALDEESTKSPSS